MFTSLHNHSYASNIKFLDSINRPKDMVKKAISLGFKGIAITDHEALSSHVDFVKIKDSIKESNPDFKIIFGNEIYLIDEKDYKNTNDFYHFILLAKDRIGYDQIRQLSSRAWDRSYVYKRHRRTPTFYSDIEEIVQADPGHIVASTACFTKGHQVQTNMGSKNIEDITAGDMVLTHDGTYQKVLFPTSRDYNDIGYLLSFRHNNKDITCTKNHKFLIYRLKQITRSPHATFKPELIWKEAQDLKLYDKTLDLMPTFLYSNIKSVDISNILKQYRENLPSCARTKYRVNDTIRITPELMRLYGLWLGDGSVSSKESHNNGRVTLSFNEKEFEKFYPFVINGLKELGDFRVIKKHDHVHHKVEYNINSSELAYLLRYISNDGKADTKFIHPKLKHISDEMDAEILYGYLLADGYFRTHKIKISNYYSDETVDATVSQQLYDDVSDLYYSVGFIPRSYICNERVKNGVHHKKAYYHTISCGPFSSKCNKEIILSHNDFIQYLKERAEQHQKGKIVTVNNVKYLLKSVKDIQKTQLQETVYCLNVENNHSFVCNNIIVHNCLGGQLAKSILTKDSVQLNNFINWNISNFGSDNFFLEMQVSDSEDQVKCNKYIIKIADHFNLKYIVTTDSHYLEKEDFKLFTSFLNSKSSSDRETEYFYKYTYLMSEQEMSEVLASTGLTYEQTETAINNTDIIYNMIEDFDFRHGTIVPTIRIPEYKPLNILQPYYEKYPIIQYMDTSEYDQDRYMMYLIELGLINKHVVLTDKIAARIAEEIDVVKYISEQLNQRISAYLNLVKVIVDICWTITPVGVSRGSAGCFYINYLMDIVQMNPLIYNIPSFRFLNKARADSLPDIDIDIDPCKNDEVVAALREYFGNDNVINCATFKTEKLKSAVLNSARALGYNNDEAQAIAALVPQQRGIMYSLKDCLEGDDEKGLVPVPVFIEKLKSYPGLYEMVEKIEGLPTNASIHASALYIFNNGYNAQNSLMKAPNGTNITALNMHDSDDCGALKMDLLKTDAETKISKAMDLLLKDKQIEWKGNLRDTYNYYLHPDKLDYSNPDMWELAADGKIPNLFQMETSVGMSAIKKMRPKTADELSTVNGLIRLTGDGDEESPVDRYTRFKKDINLWYQEMEAAGLTKEEQNLLKQHLDNTYGLCYNQEAFMLLLMDPQIGNFTLKESDKARKILAKKKVDEIANLKKQFFEREYKGGD